MACFCNKAPRSRAVVPLEPTAHAGADGESTVSANELFAEGEVADDRPTAMRARASGSDARARTGGSDASAGRRRCEAAMNERGQAEAMRAPGRCDARLRCERGQAEAMDERAAMPR